MAVHKLGVGDEGARLATLETAWYSLEFLLHVGSVTDSPEMGRHHNMLMLIVQNEYIHQFA